MVWTKYFKSVVVVKIFSFAKAKTGIKKINIIFIF